MTPAGARPTIREVARRAGVALSSVSRVLNDHPEVSDSMRGRVLEAIAELGYEPNLVASGLRRGSSRTVGFIVSDLRNPLFASIFTAAQGELSRRGYAAVITTSNSDADRDAEMARVLRRFEGPIVLLDREVKGLRNASIVATDHGSGMKQATRHLLSLGHQRIALLTGPMQVRPSIQRVVAFREVYEEHDLAYPEDLVLPLGFAPRFGELLTVELLRSPSPPTALIAGGNQILTGVLRTFQRRGIKPGQDIALVSCDDVPLTELHTPPITVIDRNVTDIGKAAARLALERLAKPDTSPRRVVLPTSLVLRDSTFRV